MIILNKKLADIIRVKNHQKEFNELIKSERTYHRHSQETSDVVRIDFHKKTLKEVKDWLFYDIEEYRKVGFNKFDCIHGYNHGTVIRDYLRNKFRTEYLSKHPEVRICILTLEKGRTLLIIRKKKKKRNP